MSRKVVNPFTEIEGYKCFGCSPNNEIGLKMSFYEDGEYIKCDWQPQERFQGYGSILHGGVIATAMDEIASWYIMTQLKTAGVTYQLNTKYKAPVYTDKGPIQLRARLKEQNRRIADIDVKLFDFEGNLCSEGIVGYFVFPEKMAKEKLYYPDFDSFFDK